MTDEYQEDYFTYTTGVGLARSFPPLDGGDTGTASIQVEADSYFKAIKLNFFEYAAVAVDDPSSPSSIVTNDDQEFSPISVDMIDDSSGRILSNNEILVSQIFGPSGGLPIILPTPRIFRARSIVRFRATNRRGAGEGNPLQLILNMVGVKGFKQS